MTAEGMRACPKCGFSVEVAWNFCPDCGYPLKLPLSLPPAYLEFIGGPEDGRVIKLLWTRVRIGRRDDNEIVIRSDRSISRRHAMLSYRDGVFWLADLDSSLGTRLGDDLVHGESPLHKGDSITLGHTRLMFCLGAPPEPEARARYMDLKALEPTNDD